ncbi:MAG: hypothetical protein MUE81_05220 [Thermoflexibacter sp.]|jgi:hypothetical protein|nr:hypothetical protein [Thermoflexibacter sp.]
MKVFDFLFNRCLSIFISLFLLFSMTACFEVKEEISMKSDGSGTYTMLIDMSKSKNLLDIFMKMNENEDKVSPAEIDSTFVKGAEDLNKMEGITNAQSVNDKKNYVFGMKFDFKDIDALNDALNETNRRKYPELESFPPIYKLEKKNLERTNFFYFKGLTDFSEQSGGDQQKVEQMRGILQTATFISIIRLPQGKIKKFSNDKFVLSEDKKELKLQANLLEVSEGKVNLENIVKIK